LSIEESIKNTEPDEDEDEGLGIAIEDVGEKLEVVVEDEDESSEVAVKDEAKVTLDTEDAPFLDEEPEEEAVAEALPSGEGGVDDILGEGKKGWASWSKKKKIIVLGASGGLLLLAIGIASWWLLFSDPIIKVVEVTVVEPEIIVIPAIKENRAPQEFYVKLEPFLIELKNDKGEPVFLVFKFTAFTKDSSLAREADNKSLVLRDAVYYYLRNKTHTYLINPANVDVIKNDLASVLSGYLAGGRIDGVLFESYLTK